MSKVNKNYFFKITSKILGILLLGVFLFGVFAAIRFSSPFAISDLLNFRVLLNIGALLLSGIAGYGLLTYKKWGVYALILFVIIEIINW